MGNDFLAVVSYAAFDLMLTHNSSSTNTGRQPADRQTFSPSGALGAVFNMIRRPKMNRRGLLAYAGMIPFLCPLAKSAAGMAASASFRRVRPSDPAWPDAASLETLNQAVGGHLIKVQPLLASCANPDTVQCHDEFASLKNP